jgi:hypothetical protein
LRGTHEFARAGPSLSEEREGAAAPSAAFVLRVHEEAAFDPAPAPAKQ